MNKKSNLFVTFAIVIYAVLFITSLVFHISDIGNQYDILCIIIISITVISAIICLILSIIVIKKNKKRLDIQQMLDKMDDIYKYAQENTPKYQKLTKRWMKITIFSIIVFSVLSLSASLAILLLDYRLVLLSAIFFAFFIQILYATIGHEDVYKNIEVLKTNEYGYLYEICNYCALSLQVKKKIILHAINNNDILVSQKNRIIHIMIGNVYFQLFNEEEWKAVFMHELSHAKHGDSLEGEKSAQFHKYINKLSTYKNNIYTYTAIYFLIWIISKYMEMHNKYELVKTLQAEILADQEVIDRHLGQALVNALAKMACYRYHDMQLATVAFYEPQMPNAHYFTNLYNGFFEVYEQNKKRWLNMCMIEMPDRFPTHPSLKDRMSKACVEEIQIDFSMNETLQQMATKRKNKCDKDLYDELSYNNKDYDYYRQKHYLQYFDLVKEYESMMSVNDETTKEKVVESLDANELVKYARAYYFICQYQKAEQLLDKVLEVRPDGCLALNLKGFLLLDRYDETGIEYLKKSTKNSNYLEISLERAGTYILCHGLKEQLQDIRLWQVARIQEKIDSSDSIKITKRGYIKKELNATDKDNIIKIAKKHKCVEFIKYITKLQSGKTRFFIGVYYSRQTSNANFNNAQDEIFFYLDNTMTEEDFALYSLNNDKNAKIFQKNKATKIYDKVLK